MSALLQPGARLGLDWQLALMKMPMVKMCISPTPDPKSIYKTP